MLRASAIAEKAGIPAVAIVSTGFLPQVGPIGRVLGIPHLPVAEYPGTIPTDSLDVIRRKAAEVVAPAVRAGLLAAEDGAGPATEAPDERVPEPREIVCSGTLEEIQDQFDARLWSDGLPIVPPTVDRVERLLAHTPRRPEEVLGVLPPDYREATVWSVAVNGVMAGCRPEYMPILVAIAEIVGDPEFRLEDAGSTPGWESLVVLSGPMVERLGFNTKTGLMRVGPRPNTSIGRFLRLFLRNVSGLRPGTTDKGSIGSTFHVALAEDDAAVQALGWPPFRVDRGAAPEDDLVTVQSVVALSPPVYTSSDDPERHLGILAYFLGITCNPWAFTGLQFRKWSPLLLLNPAVARVLAEHGWTKPRIREYLHEHATIEAHWLETYPQDVGATSVSLTNFIADGTAGPRYAESDDPNRQVPVNLRPEWINVVVAGDPGRNQSRFYVNNHEQGWPVSRRVAYVDG